MAANRASPGRRSKRNCSWIKRAAVYRVCWAQPRPDDFCLIALVFQRAWLSHESLCANFGDNLFVSRRCAHIGRYFSASLYKRTNHLASTDESSTEKFLDFQKIAANFLGNDNLQCHCSCFISGQRIPKTFSKSDFHLG